ncbi:MAG TPA: hypothetical protein PKJ68_02485 [Candidatus Woesebacteria bacterium]|nr:hypothetical protein [Candidatus Woesebacteria bacterium]
MPSVQENNEYRRLGIEFDAHVDNAALDNMRKIREARRGEVDTVRAEYQSRMNRMCAHVKHHGIHAVHIRGIAATLGPYNANTHTYALRGTKGKITRISVNQLHIELFGETGISPDCDSQCAEILHGKK